MIRLVQPGTLEAVHTQADARAGHPYIYGNMIVCTESAPGPAQVTSIQPISDNGHLKVVNSGTRPNPCPLERRCRMPGAPGRSA